MNSREVDMNGDRCSFEEYELPDNFAPTGAITALLYKRLYCLDGIGMSDAIAESEALERLLPQVKALEEAQEKKAKEEERERIVGILENMIGEIEYPGDEMDILGEAERITNQ